MASPVEDDHLHREQQLDDLRAMAFHVYMKHPKHHAAPILNGLTNRPFSWPTREAAQAYVDDCQKNKIWQSSRDDFSWIFEIRPTSGSDE